MFELLKLCFNINTSLSQSWSEFCPVAHSHQGSWGLYFPFFAWGGFMRTVHGESVNSTFLAQTAEFVIWVEESSPSSGWKRWTLVAADSCRLLEFLQPKEKDGELLDKKIENNISSTVFAVIDLAVVWLFFTAKYNY